MTREIISIREFCEVFSSRLKFVAVLPILVALGLSSAPHVSTAQEADAKDKERTRPAISSNRWQEDWSTLADAALRTEPLDSLKYLSLSETDPQRYVSFGATLRERLESNEATAFGTGSGGRDSYVIQRLQLHADLHFSKELRAFAQLEDDQAFKKQTIGSADQDRLDLRLAFLEYVEKYSSGTLKSRLGRQDFAFDLQRFVSSRDGPNVRQSFDAAWVDWETTDWRFIGFVSDPVQYKDSRAFDDSSGTAFRFDTLRVERHVLGENELSAYYSLYERRVARYGDATGEERRHIFDARFAGAAEGFDWDAEAMLQTGTVGSSRIHAWAMGSRTGYTWSSVPWHPRLGIQADAASGDSHRGDGRLGTFNPLFPNGYYFSLAGYTGYANLIQVKPSITVKPSGGFSVVGAVGALWRQSTGDAVYMQPNIPVSGTAGHGSRWTGRYEQLRGDWKFNANVSWALEAVHYEVGDAIRSVGGHDNTYIGLEAKASW